MTRRTVPPYGELAQPLRGKPTDRTLWERELGSDRSVYDLEFREVSIAEANAQFDCTDTPAAAKEGDQ